MPRPQGYVSDFAGVIDQATAAELTRLVRETEAQTSAEIAIVTVESLDGMTIEEYAVKLFAEWGIGKKARNNGVLVLVAPTERRMRIEVGYGLEPILPDALAGRVIRDECLPAFRQNQYGRGILQGVRRVADIIKRRETLSPAERRALTASKGPPPALFVIPFLAVFVALGAFAGGIGVRTRAKSPLVFAALFLIVPLGLGLLIFFTVSSLTLLPLGIAMGILGYRKGARPYWIQTMRGSAEPAGGAEAWVPGPSGSGDSTSSGGDSSSSGGGSFGGGSSGGGGASSSW